MTAVALEDTQQALIQGNTFCGAARIAPADDQSRLTQTNNVTGCP